MTEDDFARLRALEATLRSTTQEMATTCSVPMELWDRHSNAVLEAAETVAQGLHEWDRNGAHPMLDMPLAEWREVAKVAVGLLQSRTEAAASLTRQTERVAALEKALKDATAHLAAATSVYQRFCRKGVTGDALYTTRLKDFKAAIHRAHSTLKESQAPTK